MKSQSISSRQWFFNYRKFLLRQIPKSKYKSKIGLVRNFIVPISMRYPNVDFSSWHLVMLITYNTLYKRRRMYVSKRKERQYETSASKNLGERRCDNSNKVNFVTKGGERTRDLRRSNKTVPEILYRLNVDRSVIVDGFFQSK